jgi:hypothetical protein
MRLAIFLFCGPLVAGAGWRIGTKCGETLAEGWPAIYKAIKERQQYKKTLTAVE